MRLAGKIKQFFDLVFDGEIFNLASIALKNVLHKSRTLETVTEENQERAEVFKAFK